MSITTYPPAPPQRPSAGTGNVIGMVAVLLATLDCVGQVATAAFSGQAYVAAVKSVGSTDLTTAGAEVDPHMARMVTCFVIWIALWIVSLAPFILGILGAREKPRTMGVTAIVFSVLAPILAFVIFCCFIVPITNQYP